MSTGTELTSKPLPARVAYKQVFSRLYPMEALGQRSLSEALVMLPDGHLSIRLAGAPELVDVGAREAATSQVVLSGDSFPQSAETPDARFSLEIERFAFEGISEYWLIHTDRASGKFKRAKLNSEFRPNSTLGPRLSISPKGSLFIVDDSGTIRLYTAPHFAEAGTFQVAHANSENRAVALAASVDETLIAGLSAWKDIVLYSVIHRKVMFVRQIRDGVGWYEPTPAYIFMTSNAEAIITVGVSHETLQQNAQRFSVNAFQSIPLKIP